MLHVERPSNFIPDFYSAGCFVEVNGNILLLLRNRTCRIEPGKWGIPAGKIEPGETARRAIVREIEEETGLIIIDPTRLKMLRSTYVIYPTCRFVYHIFNLILENEPAIRLSGEHTASMWVSPVKALDELDLMLDEDFCIRLAYPAIFAL